MCTKTFVPGGKPYDGVNVAVAPDTRQLPEIFGERVGSGVCGESGEEKVTVMGPAPFTP
jgi:hypothetical protein